jgi:hypothetical protein
MGTRGMEIEAMGRGMEAISMVIEAMGITGLCATRRISRMRGNLHWLYQEVGEPLGRSNGQMQIRCEIAAPEKYP